MHFLAARAFSMLVLFHIYLARGNFAGLHKRVRRFPAQRQVQSSVTVEDICRAIDLACIWYPKEVLCLQRSAATVRLLKLFGYPAEMVVGARLMPFKAHAWVEVNGKVVNDKSYVRDMYSVLDRC
jgi:Transglutaminase-like superfamily